MEDLFKQNNEKQIIEMLFEYVSEKCAYGEKTYCLNEKEKNFYLCRILEIEVVNGGFDSYFYDTDKKETKETIEAFESIGADHIKYILEEATGKLSNYNIFDIAEEWQSIMDGMVNIDTIWNQLDEKFQECIDDLQSLYSTYISKNKNYFSLRTN